MAVDGKVAFITGAGRGIGRALALGFAREGYRVVVASTTMARNRAVAEEIGALGGESLPMELDVSQEANVKAAVRQARERFGHIDVLINNAALKPGSMPRDARFFKDLALPVWERMFEVNVKGVFLCTRECVNFMIEQKWGRIVNVTSGAGANGRPGESLYASSKAALNAMTRVLAAEVEEHNIAVNAITPGFTRTEEMDVERLPPQQRSQVLKTETSVPLILHLASQDPIETTGQIVDALEWNVAHGLGGREVWGLQG